ncbi:MAG TPA: tetratricopeptide repeat protein [Marmoricola sp.]|nr:tetratricopeptide repeat protein [Marmoricola sp.]
MSMPFSRPGAIDLSALKRPAPASGGAPAAGAPAGGASYSVEVDETNFEQLLQLSMAAPVVLVVYSPSRMPASVQLADDLSSIADGLEGRIAVGRVDVDAQPAIAQAMQVQTVPLVAMVLQGRLQPMFQDVPPLEELRTMFGQLVEQMTSQGMTGRHQPFAVAGEVEEEADEATDPRYMAAEDALMSGDLETAVTEYQKLVDASPADSQAALGLAQAKLLQRTTGVDLNAARAAAAEAPDDVAAQALVADLDLLGGHVEDAFNRLVELVRRTAGDDRDRARLHLLELFAVVGNEDARVLKGRQALASALF